MEPEHLESNPVSTTYWLCASPEVLPNFSVTQFAPLYNGDNRSTYVVKVVVSSIHCCLFNYTLQVRIPEQQIPAKEKFLFELITSQRTCAKEVRAQL